MVRLRDTRTEVVVDVDDATAKALGAAYESTENTKPPAKKSTSSKSEK